MAIYGMTEFWRPRPEWYALSRKEREAFVEQIKENLAWLDGQGVKLLGIYHSRALGDWDGFAFFEAPSIEGIEAVAAGSESRDWFHYYEGNNIAGKLQTTDEWAAHVVRMGRPR